MTDYKIGIHWPRMIRKARHFDNYTAVFFSGMIQTKGVSSLKYTNFVSVFKHTHN